MNFPFQTTVFLICTLLLFSCQEKQDENDLKEEHKEKRSFQMYEVSEMTALMRQMFQLNEALKERIVSGENLGDYPEGFERILEASMTKEQPMDDFFIEHAELYLTAQKSIYANPEEAKTLFNDAINACIACHKVKCTGPITKIEKLYIP